MNRLILPAVFAAVFCGALATGPGAMAQTVPVTPQTVPAGDPVDVLFEVLELDAMIAVLRQEGLAYGETLQADLFPGGGSGWAGQVSAIYDADRMSQEFRQVLRHELPADQVSAMLAFFGSDLGRRVTGLEISARAALLDDGVEEAANQMRDAMATDQPTRLAGLTRFVDANDLIDANVSSALNANLAFYQGLVDGGGFPSDMTQADILRDVWSQEAAIRVETRDWLLAFLGMAYQPLADADLDAYIAFSLTPEGRGLNRAQFAAFDVLFAGISRKLGMAAAGHMAGEEL